MTAVEKLKEYRIGDEVVITRAKGYVLGSTGIPLKDPHPEHLGKIGRITAIDDGMPHITLDEGVVLEGCDCWWRKLA